ncbi:MAG: hypothetical protein HY926_10895 [Elusimicrobia bacterium]|nr:hypothetical protein [Elusimicrobiota bacterium]
MSAALFVLLLAAAPAAAELCGKNLVREESARLCAPDQDPFLCSRFLSLTEKECEQGTRLLLDEVDELQRAGRPVPLDRLAAVRDNFRVLHAASAAFPQARYVPVFDLPRLSDSLTKLLEDVSAPRTPGQLHPATADLKNNPGAVAEGWEDFAAQEKALAREKARDPAAFCRELSPLRRFDEECLRSGDAKRCRYYLMSAEDACSASLDLSEAAFRGARSAVDAHAAARDFDEAVANLKLLDELPRRHPGTGFSARLAAEHLAERARRFRAAASAQAPARRRSRLPLYGVIGTALVLLAVGGRSFLRRPGA